MERGQLSDIYSQSIFPIGNLLSSLETHEWLRGFKKQLLPLVSADSDIPFLFVLVRDGKDGEVSR
jgi:hypothetical protein